MDGTELWDPTERNCGEEDRFEEDDDHTEPQCCADHDSTSAIYLLLCPSVFDTEPLM